MIYLIETKCKIRFIYVAFLQMKKVTLRGGGSTPNGKCHFKFPFCFWNPCLRDFWVPRVLVNLNILVSSYHFSLVPNSTSNAMIDSRHIYSSKISALPPDIQPSARQSWTARSFAKPPPLPTLSSFFPPPPQQLSHPPQSSPR